MAIITPREQITVHRDPELDAPPERRRKIRGMRRTDLYAMFGAGAGSLALTTLLFTQILPFSGLLGFVVVSYFGFLLLYALLVAFDERGPVVKDRIAGAVVHSIAFLMLLALATVVTYTLIKGWEAIIHLNFFQQDMSDAGPLEPLDVGGITHAIVGTLEQISIALLITVPLGLTCAVFLNEIPGRLSRFVRTIAEAMTALPSIIAGLFIYATFIIILPGIISGFNERFGTDIPETSKSGIAAALAISVMMLPIIIRAADVVLRLVPGSLKEASLALGSSQWKTLWHVTLPTARSGLTTAVILGTARGIGETSPVLLTAGATAYMNTNPFSGPQISLPLQTFEFVRSPQPSFIARGFGTAATLMLLVLVLFILARMLGGRAPGNPTRRQRRAAVRQSRRDLARFDQIANVRQLSTVSGSPSAPPGSNVVVRPPDGATGPEELRS